MISQTPQTTTRQAALGIITALCLAVFSALSHAGNEQGGIIAKERKARDTGWRDSFAEMTMLLSNAQGETSTRKMRIKTLEVENDGDKGLTIFDQPRDVQGTAFLSYSHTTKPDDQWLYLPALKRVKRIASRNKSGPFMGSEFAYEDLSSFELEKYQFTYLGDENVDGQPAYIVKQVPTDKYSGYTKQMVWVDKAHYRPLKVEFYDHKDSLLKTLRYKDYQQHLGKFWHANKMTMINHQNGKSTVLTTHEISFDTGLDSRDFNKASLKRAK